jgi:hypothetical protein
MIFPPLEYLGNAYDNNSGCTNLFYLEQHDTNKPACFYSHVFIGEVECDNASASDKTIYLALATLGGTA